MGWTSVYVGVRPLDKKLFVETVFNGKWDYKNCNGEVVNIEDVCKGKGGFYVGVRNTVTKCYSMCFYLVKKRDRELFWKDIEVVGENNFDVPKKMIEKLVESSNSENSKFSDYYRKEINDFYQKWLEKKKKELLEKDLIKKISVDGVVFTATVKRPLQINGYGSFGEDVKVQIKTVFKSYWKEPKFLIANSNCHATKKEFEKYFTLMN